jgi:hypothetical protein
VIVQMPTKAQAAKLAGLTNGTILRDDQGRLTTKTTLTTSRRTVWP